MAERNNDDAWGRSTIQTAWPLDYPDSCSLSVSVERGVLVTLDGSTREPVTEGYICGKVRRFGDRIYGPDRSPSRGCPCRCAKGRGQFRDVGWGQALDEIAKRMTQIH